MQRYEDEFLGSPDLKADLPVLLAFYAEDVVRTLEREVRDVEREIRWGAIPSNPNKQGFRDRAEEGLRGLTDPLPIVSSLCLGLCTRKHSSSSWNPPARIPHPSRSMGTGMPKPRHHQLITRDLHSSLPLHRTCDREKKLRELEFVALNQLLIALANKAIQKKKGDTPSPSTGNDDPNTNRK